MKTIEIGIQHKIEIALKLSDYKTELQYLIK